MDYLVDINLKGNELREHKVEGLAADPATTYAGRVYYNTNTNRLREYDGSGWVNLANDMKVVGNTTTESGEGIYNLDGTTTSFSLAAATGSGRRVLLSMPTALAAIPAAYATVGSTGETQTGSSSYASNTWVTIENDIDLAFTGSGWYVEDIFFTSTDSPGPGNGPTFDIRMLEYATVVWEVSGLEVGDDEATPTKALLTDGNTYTMQVRVHVPSGGHGVTFSEAAAGDIGLGTGVANEVQLEFALAKDEVAQPYVVSADGTDQINGSTSDVNITDRGVVLLVDTLAGKWTTTPYKTTYTKSDVGLTNVDNTTDVNKPISTAVNTELTSIDVRLDALEQEVDLADLHHSATHVSATSWSITHNLNKYPAVLTLNAAGAVIVGELDYTSANTVTVSFNTAVAGTSKCN